MARELRHGPARAREHRGCSERALVGGSFRRPNHGPACVQVPDKQPLTGGPPPDRPRLAPVKQGGSRPPPQGTKPKIVLGAPDPCRFRGPPITIQPPVVGM